ncbi:YchF family ATPase [Patescibacteria group bacterium]|nr:YchF family ATPase [Patescibacteria group bacterium]
MGIVGLPNSGKSTLFNALLQRQIAETAEYPFTTIEPNVGVVQVPDRRLEAISEATGIEKTVPAAIEFIDIAGLVKGAHAGEGLGNQFLGHIREVDAVLHLIRGFHNPNVQHQTSEPNPQKDIKVIEEELQHAGIEKPVMYVVNVDETDLKNPQNPIQGAVKVSAKLENELAELSPKEQKDYLNELGVDQTGLEKVINLCYDLLDLITFFTIVGGKQVQAWPIRKETNAYEGAGLVHTDMQKGFIKAEVVDWEKLVGAAGWKKAAEKGFVRGEGRNYKISDGDVVEFKFSP